MLEVKAVVEDGVFKLKCVNVKCDDKEVKIRYMGMGERNAESQPKITLRCPACHLAGELKCLWLTEEWTAEPLSQNLKVKVKNARGRPTVIECADCATEVDFMCIGRANHMSYGEIRLKCHSCGKKAAYLIGKNWEKFPSKQE